VKIVSYTELRFVRHAEATHMESIGIAAGRSEGAELTNAGMHQAYQLGMTWRAEAYHPDVTYTSPIRRARQTLDLARKAAGLTGIAWRTNQDMAEQCLGAHEGKLRSKVYTDHTQQLIEQLGADYTHPGKNSEGKHGESLMDVSSRMVGFLSLKAAGLQKRGYGETAAIVSHSTAIRSMLCRLDLTGLHEKPDPHQLQRNFLDYPAIGPCSQTVIILETTPSGEVHHRIEEVGRPLEDEL